MSDVLAALLTTRGGRPVTRLGHLRPCLSATALVAAAAALVGLVIAGPGQAAGAVVGAALVAATFVFGVVVVDAADRVRSSLVLPVGLAAYATTVAVLGVLVLRFAGSDAALVIGLPWGALAANLTWVPVHCWYAWTTPTPYVDAAPT